MIHLFRLVRLPNLLIIAITMAGVRYGVFDTLWQQGVHEMKLLGFQVDGLKLHMSGIHFLLLMLAIMCITAAGNIINDYFDTKTDRLNRPDKVVVGRVVKRRVAMAMHLSLNGIGLIIAACLCYHVHSWKLFGIFLFSVLGLWFYSTNLKKQLLSGNILISTLVALVPITVAVFEFSNNAAYDLNLLNMHVPGFGNSLLRKGAFIIIGYAVFAFLSNLIREIVKDMEDIEGDLAIGARTLPIVLGEVRTKYFVLGIAVFTVILLAFVQQFLWKFEFQLLFWYMLVFVQLPLVYFIVKLWNAWQKDHYAFASLLCKIFIVGGVLSMFVYKFGS